MDQALQHITRLTETQQFILDQYISESNEPWCYHTQFSYHLHIRALSLPLFFKAVKSVLDRHPVFRTVMLFDEAGEAKQGINTFLEPEVGFANIDHLGSVEQSEWIGRFLLNDRNNPFDVYDTTQPLFRAYIIKRSKDTLQFVLVFMHAIWDGWSLAVLLKEIFAYYHDMKERPTLLPSPAPYEFKEFISYEERICNNDEARIFWKNHLMLHRPYRRVEKSTEKDYMGYKPAERMLSPELSSRLQQMQLKWKVPVKSIYIAMFIRMIEDETKQSPTTIGIVTNGRSPELSNPLGTLGLLWNFAPLCVEHFKDDATHVRNVNRLLSDVSAYGSYPLLRIQEDIGISGLVQAAFNFINFEGANLLPPDSDIEFLEVGGLDKFHFPLHLLVGKNPFNRNVSLILNFDTRYYAGIEIENKLDIYVERLERLSNMALK